MTLQETLLLIYTVATVIQVITVAISVIYIYRQAVATRKSVDNLEEAARLNAYLNHRRLLTDINNVLFSNPELIKELGWHEKKDILAFMLIGYAELTFLQRRSKLVDDPMWNAQDQLVSKFMNMSFVETIWNRTREEFLPDFRKYVDAARESVSNNE